MSGRAQRRRAWLALSRSQMLALVLCAGLTALGVRAFTLALRGGAERGEAAASVSAMTRADIVDRNGLVLATLAPTYALTARPAEIWGVGETAGALITALPRLQRPDLERRLVSARKQVYLLRGMTPAERDRVFSLGLAGISFVEEARRFYPQANLAAHVLGSAGVDLIGQSGMERGFDASLRAPGVDKLETSIDLRMQYALEVELAGAVARAGALGGAGVLLDGQTGEVLALASNPSFDANRPPGPSSDLRKNRAVSERYEMGSTMKPFTIAMALDLGVASPDEYFNVVPPYFVSGVEIREAHPLSGPVDLRAILSKSSNIGAAQLALRVGAARQHKYFALLGLEEACAIELPGSAQPNLGPDDQALTVAIRGYGHAMSMSLVALAGAYTAFVNAGEVVSPTLRLHVPGDGIVKHRAFSAQSANIVLDYMRSTVLSGTGQKAKLAHIAIAGKTGTAEKFEAGGYDHARMLSSFAAIFPAEAPRYVLLLALDEPRPVDGGATGGVVAAPSAARVVTRIAPFLGLGLGGSGLGNAGESARTAGGVEL